LSSALKQSVARLSCFIDLYNLWYLHSVESSASSKWEIAGIFLFYLIDFMKSGLKKEKLPTVIFIEIDPCKLSKIILKVSSFEHE